MAGYASHWLCDNAHPGMRIHVLAPRAPSCPRRWTPTSFYWPREAASPHPMMSICKSALAEGGGKGGC
jgi:3-ketosteroid 9alpha-monooxygenase subunit B